MGVYGEEEGGGGSAFPTAQGAEAPWPACSGLGRLEKIEGLKEGWNRGTAGLAQIPTTPFPVLSPVGGWPPRTASSLASHMEPDQKPVTWSETEEGALGLTPDPVSGQGSIWHLGHVMACDLRRGQVPTWPYPCCRCVLSCVCDFWAFKCPFASTHLMAQNHHQQRIQVYAGPSPRPNWSCPTVSGFVRGSTPTTASGAEISLCPHLPLSVPRAPLPMPIGTELGLHTPTFQGGTKDRVNLERAPFPSLPSPFPILSDVDSGHSSGAPALPLCPDYTNTQPDTYMVLVLFKVGCWEPKEVRFRVAFPKAQKL